ncbi:MULTISPECIES: heat-inducible transcriptional repressor HrcA [Sporomusa]|uniref:Heat-inducible transcription repressor HrcA n=1 Tax=Sporomusa sphaeroides DSM 2875 TaxID=1337886 RepID=A0ABM9VX91_9FIRM|nr:MULTISPECIES: heat-inducible transcriptional repressor HrcA [Sporomusa]MCM0760018.1 heat-inducible transcriptional repressor HrcA [Sporomusa sphaeroides DSM 2875]OLS58359.1 heat-inducible transcription repressor HrcA [Sporomusa sphaeroides DSM 2875]CVK17454.1 Heat-inducible transcription repressor HrcA [Sporomusa sphaeroides DSM 2875]HML31666.1 heat-inducible transcriptional repressor HrcA [Sporomusa sphaeroides]
MLDERKRQILHAIIDDYISTAEPVGSRTIARKYNLGVSPATIRNEMADLELLGYIEQPHTSAGRIPSVKGYRFYVDCLLAPPQISDKDIQLIDNWYQTKARRIDEVFQETVKVLSRVTSNVSMVLAPQVSQCTFKYLQFLPLDECRSIVVIITDTGLLENKIIEIPEGLNHEDLTRVATAINSRLGGLAIELITTPVLKDIQNDILPDPQLYERAVTLLKHVLTVDKKEKVYLGGTTQMLNQPEFRDVDKVKGLLTMLEEDRLLCDILHMANSDGVVVTIGQENKYTGIHDCSVVQATYRIDGQVVGTVAVLGPTRMEYGKTMSVLKFMQRHLGEILKKYKML